MDGEQEVAAEPSAPYAGLTAAQFDLVQPFLRESVLVVGADWQIIANLSAPRGLLGWGDPIGTQLLAYTHPDDVLQFVDTGEDLSHTPHGWAGSAIVRLLRPDGTYGRYESTMHNRLEDLGAWVICTRELTDVAEVAPELGATSVARSLADALPHGVVLLDGFGNALFANQAACHLLGTTPGEFAASGLRLLISEVDRAGVREIVRRLAREPGRLTVGFGLASDGDRRFEATFVSQPHAEVKDGAGDRIFLVIVTIEDVTHRVEREVQLERRANRDALTGLRNRAWLLDHLHERLTTGARLTVAYVDLCGFKAVNDQLGHRAGDRVLAAVAAGLDAAFDDDEVAARVGGDEFVVVAEGLTGDLARHVAGRVRRAVDGVPEAGELGVTASVGVVGSVPGDEPWSLLERADQAMYEDKRRHHAVEI